MRFNKCNRVGLTVIGPGSLAGLLLIGGALGPAVAWAQPAAPAGQAPATATAAPATGGTEAGKRQYAAAAALQNAGEYELAIEEWNKFLKDFPQDPGRSKGRHYLGVCQFMTKQYVPALESFNKVLTDDPKFELAELTYLHKGLSQFKLGQAGQAESFDQAAKTFAEMVQKFPQGKTLPTALYNQGEALYARGKRAESIPIYKEVVDKHAKSPQAPEAMYAMGMAQSELGQHQQAAETFAAFLRNYQMHPLTTEIWMQYGQALFTLKNFAEAQKWFVAASGKADFEHADYALLQTAYCGMQLKQYPQAQAQFLQLPTKFPKSTYISEAYLAAGKCAYLAAAYPAARQALSQVLAVGGDMAAEGAHWTARSWLKENNPAEALKAVEPFLAKGGSFAVQLAMDQADALYEIPDRRKDSIPVYAAVAEKFPQDANAPLALFNASGAALDVQDYKQALSLAGLFLKGYANHALEPDVRFVAADAFVQQGQHAEAEAYYAYLAEKFPQHADIEQFRVRRGLATYLQKKYPETIAALTPTLTQLKTPALLAEAYYLIGASQIETKQYDAAAKSLETSLKTDPKWRQADETQLALAAAQRALNDLPKARATLSALIQNLPNSPALDRAYTRLGDYAHAANDYKTAAASFQTALEKWPQSSLAPFATHGLGLAQLSLLDFAAAEKSMTELLTKFPDHALAPKARYNRAVARQQLKQYAPAIEDLTAFLKNEPKGALRSNALYLTGLCQAGQEKHADAVATFKLVLAEDPEFASADKAWFELAWANKAISKEADAAEAFGQLATKFEKSPLAGESLFQLGEFQYQQGTDKAKAGEAENAAAEFKKAAFSYTGAATKLGATELGEKAYHKLGWAYYRMDDYAKAQATFNAQQKGWPQGPLVSDGAFMEGESWFKQNKYTEAMAAFAKVANPTSKDFSALAVLHAGQSANSLKKYDEALKQLGQFITKYPDHPLLPEALYETGFALQSQNKLDESLKYYENVTARSDREVAARARFMVGEVYFAKQDHQNAVRNFFKVAYGYGYPQWQANSLFEAGRCFEVLKKVDQAVKAYQELIQKFPQSDKVALATKRLEELNKASASAKN